MKRYAITCALILLIVVSLGTYYAFGAELRLPEYRLQTIEGDPSIAAKLTLSGSYIGGKGSYPIEVSISGSKRIERTFSDQWMRDKGPLEHIYSDLNALYEDHSGFMRRKSDVYGFYSDQDVLIFANASYATPKDSLHEGTIRWSIDSLDLTTGEQTRYTDQQPSSAFYANVIDVQKIGSEVHVLTEVSRENRNNEVIDKVFDIGRGEPVRSVELPLGAPSGTGQELRIRSIPEAKPTVANSRVLFVVTEQSEGQSGKAVSTNEVTIFTEKTFEYRYASEDLKELPPVTGTLRNEPVTSTTRVLEGDIFTTLHISDKAVTVDRYDLSSNLAHSQVTIEASQIAKGRISQAQVANGQVYLLLQTGDYFKNKNMPIAAVADAADGHILYKGTPAIVKANGRPADQLDEVSFLNMYITR
ncbi:hypothetical protein NYE24_03880 [Paenibacillus sp. FSL H7-0350]|uniref:hypothetical protein n=1 Tax=Paenibacillus sp. FSL H7-0350 TaxID=2975345 RepID=UPI003158A966